MDRRLACSAEYATTRRRTSTSDGKTLPRNKSFARRWWSTTPSPSTPNNRPSRSSSMPNCRSIAAATSSHSFSRTGIFGSTGPAKTTCRSSAQRRSTVPRRHIRQSKGCYFEAAGDFAGRDTGLDPTTAHPRRNRPADLDEYQGR